MIISLAVVFRSVALVCFVRIICVNFTHFFLMYFSCLIDHTHIVYRMIRLEGPKMSKVGDWK